MIRPKRGSVVVSNTSREATQHQVASAGKVPSGRTAVTHLFVIASEVNDTID
jgi:hypothetical protein